LKAGEIARRVADALKLVQLGDSGHVMPSQLSGGMQQRVALARALVIEPDVLLLDEPLSALDANLRASVRTELKALHERLPNLTIVCVTHDQDDALVLSDRTLLMRDGRIAQLGTPRELYDNPKDAFVARYLGAANLLRHPSCSHRRCASRRARPGRMRPSRVSLDCAARRGATAWHYRFGGVVRRGFVGIGDARRAADQPVLVTMQRAHGPMPRRARVFPYA